MVIFGHRDEIEVAEIFDQKQFVPGRIIVREFLIHGDHDGLCHLSRPIGSEVEMEDRVAALYLLSPSETHRFDEFILDALFVLFCDIFAWGVAGLQLTEHDLIIRLLDPFPVVVPIHAIIPSR